MYFNRLALATALARAGYRVLGWRRIWTHWVSGANAAMKAMRSLDVAPTRALRSGSAGRRRVAAIVHGTTLVAIAAPLDA